MQNPPIALHEEDVVSLVARAEARRRFPDLGLSDPLAERILGRLDLDPRMFDDQPLRIASVRTLVIDELVRHFFGRHEAGLAVALRPGLCTRFSRVDNGSLHWVDLEAPEVAAFKSDLVRPVDRHVIAAACSVTCARWMDVYRQAQDVPTIIVSEGALRRCCPNERDVFLTRAVERFPAGTEIILDYDARSPLRPSSSAMNACLELPTGDGGWVRYPRIRFVRPPEYTESLAWCLAGLNGASRLAQGRGMASVAHLRFT